MDPSRHTEIAPQTLRIRNASWKFASMSTSTTNTAAAAKSKLVTVSTTTT